MKFLGLLMPLVAFAVDETPPDLKMDCEPLWTGAGCYRWGQYGEMGANYEYEMSRNDCYELCKNNAQCQGFLHGTGTDGHCKLAKGICYKTTEFTRDYSFYSMDKCKPLDWCPTLEQHCKPLHMKRKVIPCSEHCKKCPKCPKLEPVCTKRCKTWTYDGCNTCQCKGKNEYGYCTESDCTAPEGLRTPRCLDHFEPAPGLETAVWHTWENVKCSHSNYVGYKRFSGRGPNNSIYYNNWRAAASDCLEDEDCMGVLNHGCNPRDWSYSLCKKGVLPSEGASKSCIKSKEPKSWEIKEPSVNAAFEKQHFDCETNKVYGGPNANVSASSTTRRYTDLGTAKYDCEQDPNCAGVHSRWCRPIGDEHALYGLCPKINTIPEKYQCVYAKWDSDSGKSKPESAGCSEFSLNKGVCKKNKIGDVKCFWNKKADPRCVLPEKCGDYPKRGHCRKSTLKVECMWKNGKCFEKECGLLGSWACKLDVSCERKKRKCVKKID